MRAREPVAARRGAVVVMGIRITRPTRVRNSAEGSSRPAQTSQ
jgi:hypothetical protein